ncbi:MAG TPA: class I SAM-dependent methyltransferase [Actinomycetota bacterium]|jgi:SAM-dependent methyltransferase
MPSYHVVAESEHELQNPTSPEKIRLLGDRMRLGSGSSVLDVGSGRGGPAMILAETFGCHITCVERAEEFDAAARRRAGEAGLDSLIEFVHADAEDFMAEREAYDAALCLGASFIWDGLPGTLAALVPAMRGGGFVAVGEPYWREWPLPQRAEPDKGEDFLPLPDTVERFRTAELEVVALIDASLDDWDRYESLHWLAAERWLAEHADDPDVENIRVLNEHFRDRYMRWQRELLGWAIIVGRKR